MNKLADTGPLEDLDHPIPRLDTYDTLVTSDQCARIGIVIATPLKDDEKSRARLDEKIRMTLAYFFSEEHKVRWGVPEPDHSRIYITIHAGTDQSMMELIEKHCAEIRKLGILPVITLNGTQ